MKLLDLSTSGPFALKSQQLSDLHQREPKRLRVADEPETLDIGVTGQPETNFAPRVPPEKPWLLIEANGGGNPGECMRRPTGSVLEGE